MAQSHVLLDQVGRGEGRGVQVGFGVCVFGRAGFRG